MIAAIMCGGKATRMQAEIEKPLLRVGNVAMIERVVSALAGSHKFAKIVAIVSPNTPETKKFLGSKGIGVIGTAGEGYPQDLSRALARLRPERVMVVPADIPLLDPKIIGDIIDVAGSRQEQAVSIVLEKEFVESMGVRPSVVFDQYCHSGITVFDTARVAGDVVQERYIVMNRKEIGLNVNTKEELALAEKLLVQRA
ncbi:MAG: NTP transferase domain-containing protein [Thermoproteota archaeon]